MILEVEVALLSIALALLILIVYIGVKKRRDLEKLDKGSLLYSYSFRTYEVIKERTDIWIPLGFFYVVFLSDLISYKGKITLFMWILLAMITLAAFTRRINVDFYEKGILYDLAFIPWERVESCSKRNEKYIIVKLKRERLGQPSRIVLKYDETTWKILNEEAHCAD